MKKLLLLQFIAFSFGICAHASIPFNLLDQNKFDELKSFIKTMDESVLTKIEERGLSSHWIIQKRTILMSVIEKSNIDESIRHDLVQTYLSRIKGNDLDLADQDGNTALLYSLYRGQIGLIDALGIVQAGANPNIIANPGSDGIDGGARGGGASPLILVSGGGQIDFTDSTELAEFAKLLIKAGAAPNQSGFYSTCPLIYAARSGMSFVGEALLDNGGSIFCGSGAAGGKDNALFRAIEPNRNIIHPDGRFKLVKAILEHGISPDETKNSIITPLAEASLNGYDDIVDLLVSNHARTDNSFSTLLYTDGQYKGFARYERATALFLAVLNDHMSTVSLLLKSNADPNIVAIDYMDPYQRKVSPLFIAKLNGNKEIEKLLKNAGANLNP